MPLSKKVRKTYSLSVSVLFSEIDNFMSKKKSSLRISPKMLKKTERHNLAVCGSLSGENFFMLIFIPFYWFDKKKVFKEIQIFLSIYPFQRRIEKNTF